MASNSRPWATAANQGLNLENQVSLFVARRSLGSAGQCFGLRTYFSDTDEMSSRPFLFRISRTRSLFLLSSTWTATRYPPFLIRSSYAFASYSGIPRPTRPPTTPPAVAPAAAHSALP